jgi:hypothetical protein
MYSLGDPTRSAANGRLLGYRAEDTDPLRAGPGWQGAGVLERRFCSDNVVSIVQPVDGG